MTEPSVERKPSQTALFTALRRALANLQYPDSRFGVDQLAIHFLPAQFRFFLKFSKIRNNTQAKLDAAFPGMTEYLIARTIWFDDLFAAALKEKTPQIVLLGAGYDSRTYRFAPHLQDTKVFELDAAPTQERKKACLKQAKIETPKQVTFIPIDFNKDPLMVSLERAGWLRHSKTLFLWEGVSYYLTPTAVDATLAFFSHSSSQGSLLAFDYAITITEKNIGEYYGSKEFFQSMQRAHANESLLFSIGEGKINAFLSAQDLKLVEHLDNKQIEIRYLSGDDGRLMGQIPGHFRFVSASPN